MTFGEAIEDLKSGAQVTRAAWNIKGVWLRLQRPNATSKMTLAFIFMSTAGGDLVPWIASHTDMLAEDWFVPDFTAGQTGSAGIF